LTVPIGELLQPMMMNVEEFDKTRGAAISFVSFELGRSTMLPDELLRVNVGMMTLQSAVKLEREGARAHAESAMLI
jgi:hypothetical protein